MARSEKDSMLLRLTGELRNQIYTPLHLDQALLWREEHQSY